MIRATAHVIRLTSAVALLLSTSVLVPVASAQVLRGVAQTIEGERPIERAQLMALNLNGKSIGTAITDENGRFYLRVEAKGKPFVVTLRRIGFEPTSSEEMNLTSRDTLDLRFLVTEIGVLTDTVRVTAKPLLNEIRLTEAKRRGWKIFPPKQVAERRETVPSFGDLIRALGAPGLIVGNRPGDCVRSTRYNRCLAIVVDDVVLSDGNPLINPRDVYFLAVLSASQSANHYGNRAPYGAIAVYTRMRGDKLQ